MDAVQLAPILAGAVVVAGAPVLRERSRTFAWVLGRIAGVVIGYALRAGLA